MRFHKRGTIFYKDVPGIFQSVKRELVVIVNKNWVSTMYNYNINFFITIYSNNLITSLLNNYISLIGHITSISSQYYDNILSYKHANIQYFLKYFIT